MLPSSLWACGRHPYGIRRDKVDEPVPVVRSGKPFCFSLSEWVVCYLLLHGFSLFRFPQKMTLFGFALSCQSSAVLKVASYPPLRGLSLLVLYVLLLKL